MSLSDVFGRRNRVSIVTEEEFYKQNELLSDKVLFTFGPFPKDVQDVSSERSIEENEREIRDAKEAARRAGRFGRTLPRELPESRA